MWWPAGTTIFNLDKTKKDLHENALCFVLSPSVNRKAKFDFQEFNRKGQILKPKILVSKDSVKIFQSLGLYVEGFWLSDHQGFQTVY